VRSLPRIVGATVLVESNERAMPTLPPMTVREVEAILRRAGFVFVRQTGHRIWRHPDGRGVSIPPHRGDLRPGTLRSIVEQAQMTEDQFLELR
jgi:predicted RNA binding protein YcfA (HicA-like mRNA interferase family)